MDGPIREKLLRFQMSVPTQEQVKRKCWSPTDELCIEITDQTTKKKKKKNAR